MPQNIKNAPNTPKREFGIGGLPTHYRNPQSLLLGPPGGFGAKWRGLAELRARPGVAWQGCSAPYSGPVSRGRRPASVAQQEALAAPRSSSAGCSAPSAQRLQHSGDAWQEALLLGYHQGFLLLALLPPAGLLGRRLCWWCRRCCPEILGRRPYPSARLWGCSLGCGLGRRPNCGAGGTAAPTGGSSAGVTPPRQFCSAGTLLLTSACDQFATVGDLLLLPATASRLSLSTQPLLLTLFIPINL